MLAISSGFGFAAVGGSLGAMAGTQPTDSQLTLTWAADASSVRKYQPTRDAASPHYGDFKNISITVSQTRALSDQAVRVSVTGFSGTVDKADADGAEWSSAQNFLQAMQCWGADPLAADFYQTCQWGGRYVANNGLGNTVYPDNTLRLATVDANPYQPTDVDVPFRTAQGRLVSAKPVLDGKSTTYPILDYFTAATTNEVQTARVGVDGTGWFDFETQTADAAPQLDCGSDGHLRCWLVIVPRGSHFGGEGTSCSSIADPATGDPYRRGQANAIQAGSPVNPACDYWSNRMVVPLDFDPVRMSCPIGAAELRTIGSQLMVGAMSSWQSTLCQEVGTTFSFSSNADSVARQLLLQNRAGLAFTSLPLAAAELAVDEDQVLLADTELSYAPVAISAVSIAFLAENANNRVERLNLSPRLLAKLLTQSYTFTVPYNSSDSTKNFAHLGAVNRSYIYFSQDPEFRTLNPDNYSQFTLNPAIVLPGPAAADAIRQVWTWILADDEARAWLAGAPDEAGMTVNPYYLPAENPAALVPTFDSNGDYVTDATEAAVMRVVGMTKVDGSPLSLAEAPLDSFPRADESQVPLRLTNEKTRFDTLQFAPYAETFLAASRDVFRSDPHSRTIWSPTAVNAAGEVGDWVSSGSQVPGQRFMIAITDTPSAAVFGLNSAAIRRANSTEFVVPTITTMTESLSALQETSIAAVRQVDSASVVEGAYPLTVVTYAAVNLTNSDVASRASFSAMITKVTTTGQKPGSGQGQLPEGYLPLTAELSAQAARAAAAIVAWAPQSEAEASDGKASENETSNRYAQDPYDPGTAVDSYDAVDGSAIAESGPVITAIDVTEPGSTPDLAPTMFGQSVLGAGFIFGLGGTIFAPMLFRGRGFL